MNFACCFLSSWYKEYACLYDEKWTLESSITHNWCHLLPQEEAWNIFPLIANKDGNSRAVKHHELLTNNHEKLSKEDWELQRRTIFTDLEVATTFMSIAFYLAFSMRKEAPSFLMVTLVLACITSFTSVLIFGVIIALGVTKGTLRKLPMRCGHVTSYLLTLALLVFAFIVMSFQNSKGTVGWHTIVIHVVMMLMFLL